MENDFIRPEIRFQSDELNWEEYKIGEIFKVTRGQVLATSKTSQVKSDKNPYPVYSSQTKNNGLMGYYNKYLFDTAITWTTDGANAGTVNFREGKFYSTNVNGVLLSEKGYANKAVAEALNLIAWKYVSKVGNPKLMNNVMSEITIALPKTIKQQEEIGDFFEKIDNIINLHQQELDTLKQTKRGFMQKMFPKEGESVPELRFPGFTEDWKACNLIDMTTLITKGTTPKDRYSKGDVNFIKVENIDSYSGAISITSKVSKEEHEGYLKRSQLKCGDILFSIAGTLGRTTVVKEDNLPANTNQALAIIRLDKGNIDFITTYLKGKAVKDYIRKNPTVGAQPNLSLQQVGNLIISYPSDLEQRRIGEFFKNLDKVIAIHQQELDALKQTKKAFLQKMFV